VFYSLYIIHPSKTENRRKILRKNICLERITKKQEIRQNYCEISPIVDKKASLDLTQGLFVDKF